MACENDCQRQALEQLERTAPGAPFLALGQTALWDEPMKGAVALTARRLGFERRLIAGVHDTDYFARHPGRATGQGYAALPHNDTTTRELWSAAGEFSALFGSETVVTRDRLHEAGANLQRLAEERPGILDRVTEAWGWRGVVAAHDHSTIIADVPLGPVYDALSSTMEWALAQTLDCIEGCDAAHRKEVVGALRSLLCDASEPREQLTLAEFYRRLLPGMYALAAGEPVPLETTRTTELLRFDTSTAALPRFEIVDLFLRPGSREAAREAYDATVRGTEIYSLDRFGSGAIPFDLVLPGHGRGTLRVAPKALIVMTPTPQFVTLKRPVASVRDLAEAVERKFGPGCALAGKALTLIGMLAREYVFVFHEGASPYVRHSRRLHQALAAAGHELRLNPILRVRYAPWEALRSCTAWLRLPEPLRQPYGADDLCAPSFAARTARVREAQSKVLKDLGALRRPLDLIRYLAANGWGSWEELAREYERIHEELARLQGGIEAKRAQRREAAAARREHGLEADRLFRAKGEHFRERVFEREPAAEDLAERERLETAARAALARAAESRRRWRALLAEQEAMVRDAAILQAHERRREIELEAELKRVKLARQAIIASEGLAAAGRRPSAWWFPVLCPRGDWFRETAALAEYYLEPLA
jgi:hypothetical protein